MGDFSESPVTRYFFVVNFICYVTYHTDESSSLMYNSEVPASARRYKLNEGNWKRKGGVIYLRLEYSLRVLSMLKVCFL